MEELKVWDKEGTKGSINLESFKIETIDGYINATELLNKFNEEYGENKKLLRMNEFMKNNKFKKQVVSDFNKAFSEVQFLDFRKISEDDKVNYMIHSYTLSKGRNIREKIIYVHPMVAVGLAMWMSPSFGSQVKEIFLRYSNGDLKMTKEVVDNHDRINSKETSLEIVQKPGEKNSKMIAKIYNEGSQEIKDRYDELLDAYGDLLEEKDILIQDIEEYQEKIEELEEDNLTLKGMMRRMNKNQKRMEKNQKNLEKKLDSANHKLDIAQKQRDVMQNQLYLLQGSLDEVLQDRVLMKYINKNQGETIAVYKDLRNSEEFNICVIRSRIDTIDRLAKSQREKYEIPKKKFEKIFQLKNSPNARIFWLSFMKKFGKDVEKYGKTNWFKLLNDEELFKRRLFRLDGEKYEVENY